MKDLFIGQQSLSDLFDALGMGAIVVSPDRQVIEINQTAQMLAAPVSGSAVGKKCHEIFQSSLCGGGCPIKNAGGEALSIEHVDIEITDAHDETRSFTKIICYSFGF